MHLNVRSLIRLRRKRNNMYKLLLMISVFLLPGGPGTAHSVSKTLDNATTSTQSKKSNEDDSDCGICNTGSTCYYCTSENKYECLVTDKPPPSDCSPAVLTFKFLVKGQVVHLDAKKYNKYACKPPQVMKKLGNNLIECVDPSHSAKSQAPAKSDSPQTDASR